MTKINLITPPDRIFNDSKKVVLIHPSTELKNDFEQIFLKNLNEDVDIYLFEQSNPGAAEFDWLLVSIEMADAVIVDIDNCDPKTRSLVSYIISKTKTYWLTNSDQSVYNHISKNRIYNLDNFYL